MGIAGKPEPRYKPQARGLDSLPSNQSMGVPARGALSALVAFDQLNGPVDRAM